VPMDSLLKRATAWLLSSVFLALLLASGCAPMIETVVCPPWLTPISVSLLNDSRTTQEQILALNENIDEFCR